MIRRFTGFAALWVAIATFGAPVGATPWNPEGDGTLLSRDDGRLVLASAGAAETMLRRQPAPVSPRPATTLFEPDPCSTLGCCRQSRLSRFVSVPKNPPYRRIPEIMGK